jgi:hypothetical protein
LLVDVNSQTASKTTRLKYLSLAGLKAQGWTDAGVRKFLGEPDKLATNLHYASGPKVRLYAQERVHEVMATPDWQAWRVGAAVRSDKGKGVANRKRMALIATVKTLGVVLPVLKQDELITRACAHYNAFQETRLAERGWDDDFTPAAPASNPAFLERICVNYLRHACTRYEQELDRIFGKVGVEEAREELFRHICEKIAAVYPRLAAACEAQVYRRWGDSP